KHICLVVLDALLLQIVRDLPRSPHHARRLSDPSCTNLLSSITHHTNTLHEFSSSSSTLMIRSQSSPTPAIMSDIHRILDSSHHTHQDYTLCCSLAALLNDVYRLLELNATQQQQDKLLESTTDDVASLQQELHDKVSTFQKDRAQGVMSILAQEASQEMIMLWDEMDHLMNIVTKLAVQQWGLPAYDKIPKETPPAYDTIHPCLSGKPNDLDQLLDAMDRLSHAAPRLNNQRVCLSESQVEALAAATLGKNIERLSRGRMEDQRASLPLKTRHQVLQDLVHQVQKSASRSLDNQRVSLNVQTQKKMEFASLCGLVNRLEKTRYTDQEWISREERLIHDLLHTTDLLAKSLDRPAYQRQRFSMSAIKKHHLFMSGLLNKVEKLERHRLVDQDAEFSNKNTSQDREDLYRLLNRIYQSTKPQLDNQRASFTV
ncbi:hypothetical protein CU098_006520, partial [Rhizopus stolonifer]